MKDSQELFRQIADEAFMAFIVFDSSGGNCLYCNSLAHHLFGISDGTKPKLEKIFAGEGRSEIKPFNRQILEHEGLYQALLVNRVQGPSFIASVGVKKLTSSDQNLVLLMFQDVTLQMKMQRDIAAKQTEINSAFEEVLKQNKQLKELDLAKDRFIALTTHELRTPLSAMVASAEILHLGLYDSEIEMKGFVSMIYEQGLQMQELVNDILDFAKIQAGKMDYYVNLESPKQIVSGVISNLKTMAEADQVELELTECSTDLSCYFDDLRLRQVISNLINNAIKYNRKNGSVKVWFESKQDFVEIHIQDTGKGIPEEKFETIFNEFETIGQVSEHHKGTGLGLPISRRLIQGMGGDIHLSSQLGKGSHFWILVPKNKVLDEASYRPRPDAIGDFAA